MGKRVRRGIEDLIKEAQEGMSKSEVESAGTLAEQTESLASLKLAMLLWKQAHPSKRGFDPQSYVLKLAGNLDAKKAKQLQALLEEAQSKQS